MDGTTFPVICQDGEKSFITDKVIRLSGVLQDLTKVLDINKGENDLEPINFPQIKADILEKVKAWCDNRNFSWMPHNYRTPLLVNLLQSHSKRPIIPTPKRIQLLRHQAINLSNNPCHSKKTPQHELRPDAPYIQHLQPFQTKPSSNHRKKNQFLIKMDQESADVTKLIVQQIHCTSKDKEYPLIAEGILNVLKDTRTQQHRFFLSPQDCLGLSMPINFRPLKLVGIIVVRRNLF
uniref:Skp1_POZ domain-containing protein n=1 Tax=Rhabditophanes sp. KR3021 TaxID=114890 RepID=A0AC35TWI2_9BILA